VDKNIETYLRQLQDAMVSAGADPALVQDAMFDAEEHLQSEMAAGGDFATVAASYGSPDEVAAAYTGTVPVYEMAAAMAAPHPGGEAVDTGAAVAEQPAGAEAEAAATSPVPGETIVAPEVGTGWIEVGAAPAAAAPPEAAAPADSTVPPEPAKVFCSNCGSQSELGQAFCRTCGGRLPSAEQLAAGAKAAGPADTAVRPSQGAEAPPTGGRPPFGGQPYGAAPQGRYPVGVQTGMAAAEAGRTQAERSIWRDIFGPFIDPRTWTALVYMILSLGLGILYFTVVVTGVSLSLGLFVLIIGIPMLVLVLAIVRGLSLFEGRLVEVLLGTRMPRRLRPVPPNLGIRGRIEFWLNDGRTWLSMLYMLLMLPLGIVYFTVAVTLLSVSLGLITSPIWGWFGNNYTFWYEGQAYTGDFPTFLIPLAFVIGVLLLIGTMHAIRWIGRGHAMFAKAMLVRLR
jgi:hypothetical protein